MSPNTPPPPPPFTNAPGYAQVPGQPGGPQKTSGAAVASFVLGVLSLFCLCLTALPGVICGFVALSNIGESNGRLKGRGLAILGILLSLLLTVVGGAAYVVYGGKQMASNPMFQEIFGAGKAMMKGVTNGTAIAASLKAHATANEGRLPGTLDELVASGELEASKLANPIDGSAGFWQLTQPAGTVLDSLPPRTIIARGGPISVQDESLEVVIYADGTVEPRDGPSSSQNVDPPVIPEDASNPPAGATEVPAPVESPEPQPR